MHVAQQVLLVDADPRLAEVVTRMLDAAHFTTTTVRSGEAALRFLRGRPGLLTIAVVNLRLPDTSGHRLAEIIPAEFPEAGILFMAADPADVGEPLPGPLLTQPFTGDALDRAIEALLARHRRHYLLSADHSGRLRLLAEAAALHDRRVQTHTNRVHDLLRAWQPHPLGQT